MALLPSPLTPLPLHGLRPLAPPPSPTSYAGNSVVWPMSLWEDPQGPGPSRSELFVATCNASDPFQQWQGAALTAGLRSGTGAAGATGATGATGAAGAAGATGATGANGSTIKNQARGMCLSTVSSDPVGIAPCDSAQARNAIDLGVTIVQ